MKRQMYSDAQNDLGDDDPESLEAVIHFDISNGWNPGGSKQYHYGCNQYDDYHTDYSLVSLEDVKVYDATK